MFRPDWPNLIVEFILAVPAAYGVHSWYDRRQEAARVSLLRAKYGKLEGEYSNYRAADGTPTGGSIKLTQKSDGSFDIVGLHSDRTVDWKSVLWMDEKYENRGLAHYRYTPGGSFGVQVITFIPETGELHVKGVKESSGPPIEFHHIWRPKVAAATTI